MFSCMNRFKSSVHIYLYKRAVKQGSKFPLLSSEKQLLVERQLIVEELVAAEEHRRRGNGSHETRGESAIQKPHALGGHNIANDAQGACVTDTSRSHIALKRPRRKEGPKRKRVLQREGASKSQEDKPP